MADDLAARARSLFDRVAEMPQGEQAALLDDACRDDPDLRARVLRLLAFHRDDTDPPGDGFLKSPLIRPSPTNPTLPHDSGPPLRIGHYRVVRVIGSGGMGTVYEAEQESPHRTVALKVLRHGLASPALLKRFAQEAEVLGRLHHPGIAQVHEAGVAEDGQPFFSMEYIRGQRLDEYARLQALTASARLELAARVCDAMQHAHEQGVVHRDLKPANILVEESGQPKVLDFGIARAAGAALQSSTAHTETGHLLGTVGYMSPEQVAGRPSDVDVRSDVYALGVILFELLAGRLPYDLDHLPLAEVARVIHEHEPPRLGSLNGLFRGEIETIVARALEKDRARRYPSAAELAADLRRHLAHEPILARPPSALYQLRKFARRHRALVGGAAGVFLALVVGLIGTAWFALGEAEQRRLAEAKTWDESRARNQSEQNRREARRNLYIADVRLALQAWEQGQPGVMRGLLEEAASGGQDDEDLRGFEWHYLWRQAHPAGRAWRGHGAWVSSVAYSPDGRWLASASMDQTVRLWEAADGRLAHTLKGHRGNVGCVCFSPDGRRLATGASDTEIRIWDIATGALLLRWGTSTHVIDLTFSRDGGRLASTGMDGAVRLWESSSGKELLRVSAHEGFACGVAFSPEGQRFASIGQDGQARVWSADGKLLHRLVGHAGIVRDVAFSPDGRSLATAGEDGTAHVWDLASARPLVTFTGHREPVRGIAFSPDGTQLASAGGDRVVRVWDAASGMEVALLAHGVRVESVAFSPDGTRIALTDIGGTVRVWELASPNSPPPLKGHHGLVYGVAFSPDNRRLATAGIDRTVRLWRAIDGNEILALRDHAGAVRGVAFSPVGDLLASVGDDKLVRLWGASDVKPLKTLTGHIDARVHGVAFDPTGARVASAGRDGTVRVWDVADGQEVLTLRGHVGAVLGVAYSHDGTRLASAGEDRTVRLWDASGGESLLTLQGHQGAVNSVSFAAVGRRLASGGDDGSVRLWDTVDGRELHVLRGHAREVRCVAFSPDGSRLASTGLDSMVCLWDAASGKPLLTLRGSTRELFGLAFSPDGARLALAGRDLYVRVW